MKTNKNRKTYAAMAILTLGMFCPGVMAGDQSFDLVAGYHWLSPGKDADWKNASGLELQGRFWRSAHLGIALVGSADTWKARTEITEEDSGNAYASTSIMGDASVTSLGASVLYRSGAVSDVKLVMDFGLRYAMVDSAVYAEAAYDGPGGPNYLYDKIHIDNTMLFVAGAGLEFEVSNEISLTLGVSCQVDINKPEERFAGSSLGETGLDAVSFGVLLSCKF
ncbi:MAG: hypothetical protein C0404_02055 [Verrucomicrobia bacterium]|nr:hypothetical protein [Verrucomicrobiota bacterium]